MAVKLDDTSKIEDCAHVSFSKLPSRSLYQLTLRAPTPFIHHPTKRHESKVIPIFHGLYTGLGFPAILGRYDDYIFRVTSSDRGAS